MRKRTLAGGVGCARTGRSRSVPLGYLDPRAGGTVEQSLEMILRERVGGPRADQRGKGAEGGGSRASSLVKASR